MWGTPPSPSRKRSHERFIPTHVGNTSRHGRGARRTPVHPHACGEHRTGSPCLSRSSGSSPRMWGTRNFRETVNEHPRFIPTHVGNTPAGAPPPRCASVHPHACGEHDGEIRGRNGSLGSSPRMWGTLVDTVGEGRMLRFIPTHVGNTHRRPSPSDRQSVHPHACGEHGVHPYVRLSVIGSSPRMWGTPKPGARARLAARFIPTHVGNTPVSARQAGYPSVHPHACGEHRRLRVSNICGVGSSPRMWGTLREQVQPAADARFIPTHVGNTYGPFLSSCSKSVHPHACGEHISLPLINNSHYGSSPRMWGTLPSGLY